MTRSTLRTRALAVLAVMTFSAALALPAAAQDKMT